VKLGIDKFLTDSKLKGALKGKRIALLGHPASMTGAFIHSLDALVKCKELNIVSAFGPQHGMRGEKQDNMIESEDYTDPRLKIPVFSLYGKTRRPTQKMLNTFDVLLVDLQDLGTRVYTFLTTLFYILEDAGKAGKTVWVLDRPNPAGRPIDGTILEKGHESFVGGAQIPMRHGLTLGEAAIWFVKTNKISVNLKIIKMEAYAPNKKPGFGWPLGEISWVNPSPNASSINMARCYPGTVLLEGTNISEGRGTTSALEMLGTPDIDMNLVLARMLDIAPNWLKGCQIRPCYFEPTFHKHKYKLCRGIQIHTDYKAYVHSKFKPYRLIALLLKSIKLTHPNYELWRSFEYEYVKDRLAIDVINGGPSLREWVDNPKAKTEAFEARLIKDEKTWEKERRKYLIYT